MPKDHENVPDIPANNDAESVLKWAIVKFGGRVGIASSFGAEDVVLIDMAARIDPFVRVFTLDTGRLHQETYKLMDVVRDRYRIEIEICFPEEKRIWRAEGSGPAERT